MALEEVDAKRVVRAIELHVEFWEKGMEEKAELNQVANEGEQAPEETQQSPEEILARELAEAKDRYIRLLADFENFKRRTLKEQSELLKYQGERLVVDLLEVLDNLELALAHSSAEYDQLKSGLEMVHRMFIEKLSRWEIRGEGSMGKEFDPHKHAAISKVPGNSATPGTIVGELKKPYFYKDKLIRVGEVVVATE